MKVRMRRLSTFTVISLLSLFGFADQASAQNSVLDLVSGSPRMRAKTGETHRSGAGAKADEEPSGYTYGVLYSFGTNSPDGVGPEAGLIQDAAGNLYGTTQSGGKGGGTVFRLDTTGHETVLYTFCSSSGCTDGEFPEAALIRDSAGNLYGTTYYGGNSNSNCDGGSSCGVVFKVNTAGQETILYSFCSAAKCADGANPRGGLTQDSSGNLYGTTYLGGANEGAGGLFSSGGTVFKVDSAGHETVLYNFCSVDGTDCTDGAQPLSGLIEDSADNLWGTTYWGGSFGSGALFKVDKMGKETAFYSFDNADGQGPYAGVIEDAADNLYGTTWSGGANCGSGGCKGTAFKVNSAGNGTVLYNFCSLANCADGWGPQAGLIQDAAGNLYGTTPYGGANGYGTVFKLDSAGNETVLYSFCSAASCTDGEYPEAALIQDAAGNLYGTTGGGGAFGLGTVFKLTAPGSGSGIITFEAADAGSGALQGTAGISINTAGAITGEYTDANYVYHGFVRATDGTITEFDASGAGTGVYQGTFPSGINTKGTIAGTYTNSSKAYNGFVRAKTGAITEFGVPGAGTAGHQGTFPIGINTSGAIAGGYKDSGNVYHGFTRNSKGAITPFDAPGAGTAAHEGTIAIGINTAGTIAGTYIDASGLHNGFVRATSGTITPFDAAGAAHLGTVPVGINTKGIIVGTYTDTNGVYHGFVRATSGAITSLDAPGAGKGTGQGTVGLAIDTAGTITGSYADSSTVYHGFLRTASGTITSFDAPGAGPGASLISLVAKAMGMPMPQGTAGLSINTAGAITGGYTDVNDVYHGFLVPVLTATKTTITSSPNPSTFGEAVTFTATVTPAPPNGETVPFMKGKTVLGTGTLSGGSATFITSTLKVGTTSVVAVYGGDPTFAGSKSKALKQVVVKAD